MPRADVTIRFSSDAPAFAYLTGARVQTRTAACSAFGTSGNAVDAEVSGGVSACSPGTVYAYGETAEFPVYTVYSNIMADRGFTPVSASVTHYWEWETRDEAFAAYPVYNGSDQTHTLVSSITALATAISNADPGDTIFLNDGNYSDAVININVSGNASNRITICARTKLGVYLNDSSKIVINGDYIDVFGFRFQDTITTHLNTIEMNGDYNRGAFCYFKQLWRMELGFPTAIIRNFYLAETGTGRYNRACYNTFDIEEADTKPVRMQFAGNHWMRFDHNLIKDILGVTGNSRSDDFEAIQTGGGGNPDSIYDYALCDNNYILRQNNLNGSRSVPDDETTADKSSGNMFIRNAFIQCCGHPNARRSHRSTYYANFIIADHVEKAGGVFTGGDECWVFCNYVQGTSDRATVFRAGDDVSYLPSDNGEYSFNIHYDCSNNINFGGYGSGQLPNGNNLYNNAVLTDGARNSIPVYQQTNTSFAGNIFSPPLGITNPGGITVDDPDLIPDNGYRVPSNTGNCLHSGSTGWNTSVITVDILGNSVPTTNPNVGCFQTGFDLSIDPVEKIKNNAGAIEDYYFTNNTVQPYTVDPDNAEIITTYSGMLAKAIWRDGFSAYRVGGIQYIQIGGGYNYYFLGNGTKDLIIDLSGIETTGLAYPIDIRNYNNVLIRGVFMNLIEQQYEWYSPTYLPQISGPLGTYSPASIYKRLSPFGGAIRLDVKGKITIEGCDVRINGQEGDFIIYRGNYATNHGATGVRVINTRVEGQVTGDDFDGLKDDNGKAIYTTHSDFFHNQGSADNEISLCAELQVENITYRTSQNGMIIQARGQSGGGNNDWPYKTDLLISKCDFRQCNDWNKVNPVYGLDTYGGNTGFAATGALSSLTMDNITYGAPDHTMRAWGLYTQYFWDSGEAANVWINANTNPTELTYTQSGDTQIDRAPAAQVGYNYVSPFGDVV